MVTSILCLLWHHVFITPRGNRVIVIDDEGTVNILGPLHINAVIQQPNGE